MAAISNVGDLFEYTKLFFTAQGVQSSVHFGWSKPAEQKHDSLPGRVVFVPGDASGKVGAYGVASQANLLGVDPVLQTQAELVTIYVWARDADFSRAQSDIYNYRAVTALSDWVLRALFAAAEGRLGFDPPTWVVQPQNTLGKEMLLGVTLRRPITSQPSVVLMGPPGTQLTSAHTGKLGDSVGCCDTCDDEEDPGP